MIAGFPIVPAASAAGPGGAGAPAAFPTVAPAPFGDMFVALLGAPASAGDGLDAGDVVESDADIEPTTEDDGVSFATGVVPSMLVSFVTSLAPVPPVATEAPAGERVEEQLTSGQAAPLVPTTATALPSARPSAASFGDVLASDVDVERVVGDDRVVAADPVRGEMRPHESATRMVSRVSDADTFVPGAGHTLPAHVDAIGREAAPTDRGHSEVPDAASLAPAATPPSLRASRGSDASEPVVAARTTAADALAGPRALAPGTSRVLVDAGVNVEIAEGPNTSARGALAAPWRGAVERATEAVVGPTTPTPSQGGLERGAGASAGVSLPAGAVPADTSSPRHGRERHDRTPSFITLPTRGRGASANDAPTANPAVPGVSLHPASTGVPPVDARSGVRQELTTMAAPSGPGLSSAERLVGPFATTMPMTPGVPLTSEPLATTASELATDSDDRATLDRVLPTQVIQSIRVQWTAAAGEARVQLRPEYLGELTVAITVERGAVVATLSAESSDVRRWIEAHVGTLRDGLAEHGLRLDRIEVHEPPDTSHAREDERRPGQQAPRRQAAPRRRRRGEAEPTFELDS